MEDSNSGKKDVWKSKVVVAIGGSKQVESGDVEKFNDKFGTKLSVKQLTALVAVYRDQGAELEEQTDSAPQWLAAVVKLATKKGGISPKELKKFEGAEAAVLHWLEELAGTLKVPREAQAEQRALPFKVKLNTLSPNSEATIPRVIHGLMMQAACGKLEGVNEALAIELGALGESGGKIEEIGRACETLVKELADGLVQTAKEARTEVEDLMKVYLKAHPGLKLQALPSPLELLSLCYDADKALWFPTEDCLGEIVLCLEAQKRGLLPDKPLARPLAKYGGDMIVQGKTVSIKALRARELNMEGRVSEELKGKLKSELAKAREGQQIFLLDLSNLSQEQQVLLAEDIGMTANELLGKEEHAIVLLDLER